MTGEEIKDELYRMLSDVLNGNGPIRNNAQRGRYREAVKSAIKALEQKPICPSAGVDCEDCPAYEDAISRYQKIKQMLYELKEMPLAPCLMKGHTCAVHEILNEVMEPSTSSSQKPKSEWEHDHEILKAYSDGANAVLESLIEQYEHYLELLDADMKDGSATIVTKTKYAVYTEVVKQLKEVEVQE